MKFAMKKIILILLILLPQSINSQWFWSNPKPQGNSLYSVQAVTENVFYALGDKSTILKSTNAGLNWIILNVSNEANFNSLHFINENTGFAAAGGKLNLFDTTLVIKTTNGGINWNVIYFSSYGKCMSVYFSDVNTGYVSIYSYWNPNKVVKTTNGGLSWSDILPSNAGKFRDMNFLNAQLGYVLCDSGIIKTSTGGMNWSLIRLDTNFWYNKSLFYLSENTGYVGGSGKIRITYNGGINWHSYFTEWQNEIIDLFFCNTVTGYTTGGYNQQQGFIYKTTNSGINWNLQMQDTGYLTSISFINPDKGVSVGYFGHIHITSNGGINWMDVSGGPRKGLLPMHFINVNTGFIAEALGDLYKTTDGGGTWIAVNNALFESPSDMHFMNENTGFIAEFKNNNGIIRKTTDGGSNWTITFSKFLGYIYTLYFINNNTGFCNVGKNIYKTTNSGEVWDSIYSCAPIIKSIYFTDINTGYAFGGNTLYKTTNCGISWITIQTTIPNNDWSKVVFTDVNTGYILGWMYNTTLFKSTNGGFNWIQVPYQGRASAINFVNNNTGWVAGAQISKTTNGGLTWAEQNNPSDAGLRNIFILNENVVYICGGDGTILKTTNGGGDPVSIDPGNYTETPVDFFLHQNYPNPFNPITKIVFDISASSPLPLGKGQGLPAEGSTQAGVRLSIYNSLGQHIETLVNKSLSPGTYEVSFDGSNYPSGVYFYKLTSGDFTDSKKMILIK